MDNEIKTAWIYKPLIAAVLAGYIGTILNLIYDVVFRDSAGFLLSGFISVSSIIFATMLIVLVAGAIYAILGRFMRRPTIIFEVVFVIITVLCAWGTFHIHRTDDAHQNLQFQELLAGLVVISGASIVIGIPLLMKKDSLFF